MGIKRFLPTREEIRSYGMGAATFGALGGLGLNEMVNSHVGSSRSVEEYLKESAIPFSVGAIVGVAGFATLYGIMNSRGSGDSTNG